MSSEEELDYEPEELDYEPEESADEPSTLDLVPSGSGKGAVAPRNYYQQSAQKGCDPYSLSNSDDPLLSDRVDHTASVEMVVCGTTGIFAMPTGSAQQSPGLKRHGDSIISDEEAKRSQLNTESDRNEPVLSPFGNDSIDATLMESYTVKNEDPEPEPSTSGSPKVTFNISNLNPLDSDRDDDDRKPHFESITYLPEDLVGTEENPPQSPSSSCVFPIDVDSKGSFFQPDLTHKHLRMRPRINVSFCPSSLAVRGDPRTKAQTTPVILEQALGELKLEDPETDPEPQGILKTRQPESPNEKLVSKCLDLLCQAANAKERYQAAAMFCHSASEVFGNLCPDHFFQNGECFNSECDKSHYYKPHALSHPDEQIWLASVYVISQASQPNVLIVENLFQHYANKKDAVTALLFSKCIARVRRAKRLELAQYIVNVLSETMPMRDVVTIVLMMNFSQLSTSEFIRLTEGLSVFAHNTTHYSELMAFLNFRGCLIPGRLLAKLMSDALANLEPGSAMVESISGFLARLPSEHKRDVQSTVEKFAEKFGLPLNRKDGLSKKTIRFADKPQIREFYLAADPDESDGELSDVKLEDSNIDSVIDEPDIDVHVPPRPQTDPIHEIGGSCATWILSSDCPDPGCRFIHGFTEDSFVGLSSNDVNAAADFIVNGATNPSFSTLKLFIEYLAECEELTRVLNFRKCATKLPSDSLALTVSVISVLGKQIGLWEAVQKVLVPDVYSTEDEFVFDEKLLQNIMTEAISRKETLMMFELDAILRRVKALPPGPPEFTKITAEFTDKFVVKGRKLRPYPDILPLSKISVENHLEGSLYDGLRNNYFLPTVILKLADDDSLKEQALNTLGSFLLSNRMRAGVITQMLENCKYLDARDRKFVTELVGTAGLSVSLEMYKAGDTQGTAALLDVLKKFEVEIFSLESNATEFELAVMYCCAMIDTNATATIDVFLERCVSLESPCPLELVTLTAKMFEKLTSAGLAEETFRLCDGIFAAQGSLRAPLDIAGHFESILRCSFNLMYNNKFRVKILKLYVDFVDSGSPVTFQKVTHRSVLLIALLELNAAASKENLVGPTNIMHPLLKKILMTCIGAGAYPALASAQITLTSSMILEEIRVYVLWWFVLYVRARKKQSVNYFPPVKVAISTDFILDDSTLPIHPDLHYVDPTIVSCANRLDFFLQHIFPGNPFAASSTRKILELNRSVVVELSQTAVDIMNRYGYIDSGFDGMCVFCFEKPKAKISDKELNSKDLFPNCSENPFVTE